MRVWESRFPAAKFDCREYTEDQAKWKTWVKRQVNGKEREVLDVRVGTRYELLREIRTTYRQVIYHWTLKSLTRLMQKLDVATFNGKSTVVMLTDFAASAQLKGAYQRTCEHPTTANEDVAIVLHSPGE